MFCLRCQGFHAPLLRNPVHTALCSGFSVAPDVKKDTVMSMDAQQLSKLFFPHLSSVSFFKIALPPWNCEAGVSIRHACTASHTEGRLGPGSGRIVQIDHLTHPSRILKSITFAIFFDQPGIITKNQNLMMSKASQIVHKLPCIIHLDIVIRAAIGLGIFRTDYFFLS